MSGPGWDGMWLRLSTAGELLRLFAPRGRFVVLPLVLVLLLGSALWMLTELFPAMAPFAYAVF